MIPITGEIAGLKGVADALRAMEARVFRKATRRAVDQGTKLVLAAAKANVPTRTGSLRKSLGRKVVALKNGGGYVGVVGPRKDLSERRRREQQQEFEQGKRKRPPGKPKYRRVVKYKGREITVNPIKYAHLVEYGRAAVTVKNKRALSDGEAVFGKRTLAMAPRPFLRPAWEASRAAIEAMIAQAVRDAIQKAGK